MVNRGTNALGYDRSKTAGGRNRRMASERKRRLAEAGLYSIKAVRFGLYKDGDEWVLTALRAKRYQERLVSDRQGGSKSEVVGDVEARQDDPRLGFYLKTFDTKKEATGAFYTPDSWNKWDSGEYYGEGVGKSFKKDRERWRDWAGDSTTRDKSIK